jgi:hypothetical protein
MQNWLVSITTLAVLAALLALGLVKILALVNTVVWIVRHGAEFRTRLDDSARPWGSSLDERDRVFDEYHADFPPFGIMGYRLGRILRHGSGGARRLFHLPLRLYALLSRFYVQVTATAVALSFLAWLGGGPTAAAERALALGLSAVTLINTLLIAVDMFVAFTALGSFGRAFYRSSSSADAPRHIHHLGEMKIFVGAVAIAYLAVVSVLLYTAARIGGFAPAGPRQLLPWSSALRFAAYRGLVAVVGVGDPSPTGGEATVVAALALLVHAAFLLVVFGSLLDVMSREGKPSPIPAKPEPSITAQPRCDRRMLLPGVGLAALALLLRALVRGRR